MVVSGSQIVFPPLEHANFHCGHCTAPVFLCNCCGVGHGKDYVLMGCGAAHTSADLTHGPTCRWHKQHASSEWTTRQTWRLHPPNRLPPLPSHPTPVERLVRWATITSAHPGTSHFDACRFIRDMVDRNMLFTLSLVRPELRLTLAVYATVVPA
jgi:hypothetical protein